jgi:ATP-dependent DNA helicase RecQ
MEAIQLPIIPVVGELIKNSPGTISLGQGVVHYQPPDCIEAYFQEAGRGGRDGKPAFGALLYDERDIDDLTYQLKNAFPEKEEIRKIYQALVNYFQLAVGSGKDEFMEFDLMDFCKVYNL